MGYKCDKKELRKSGSDLDVATMYESIRYCYNDLMTTVTDGGEHGISSREFIFLPKCTYRIIQDGDATVEAVKSNLRIAVQDELAIVYFSCKATQVPATTDKEEEDGLDEALMLYDGLLLDNDIWEILQTAKGRVFIVFDTGHSATMFKAARNGSSDVSLFDLITDIENQPKSTGNLNMVCWSACLDNEKIDERCIGSKMTNAFYFKMEKWDTYQTVYDKVFKKLKNKQNMNKTVYGEDFSNLSMFR